MRFLRRRPSSTPPSDAIWNRAAAGDLPPGAGPGDVALRDALELHGYVMNGGLGHGLEVMGADVERAASGWDRLGRGDVAALLRDALATAPGDEATIELLEDRYVDDRQLEEAFLRRLRDHPDDFADPLA